MALDKQMILSELGSVMNKLQSADCGCMGKLFSNQGQYSNQQGGHGGTAMGTPLPTCGGCRRGCCHGHGYGSQSHGYSVPYAGEPYSPTSPCMGMQCNPHKLYADTYNYLSSNLMKPVVQEVYQDLKSINPANSVVNNPDMANKMGLQQQGGGAAMQGNMGMTQNQMPAGDMGGMQNPGISMNQQMGNQQMGYQQMGNQQMGNQQMGNQQMGNQQMGNQQMGNQQMGNQQMGNQQMGSQQMSNQSPMGQMMGGMGPNIVNMMQGEGKSGQAAQMPGAMTNAAPQGQVPAGMAQGQYNANNASSYGGQQVESQYMQQNSNAMNPNSQNAMGGNMQQNAISENIQQNAMGGNMQQNSGQPGASYKVNYSNPAAQQMSSNRGQQNFGKHTPGVAKFNEMFPGVMGGMGGDLGFDPMAIAIQMNPQNQQQAAMGTMQKLMNGNPIDRVLDPSTNTRTLQPAIAGASAAVINQPPSNQQNIPPSNQQPMPGQPGATQQNLQGYANVESQPNQVPQQVYGQVPQQQQQQVYTATGLPTINQNQPPQQYQQPNAQQYQQQQITDPNTPQYQQQNVDPNTQQYQQNIGNINEQQPQSYSAPPASAPEQTIKEPIFPVDTSKNLPPPHMNYQRQYEYNTLGQPVEMLPARLYHPAPDTNTQQTLSPQPVTKMRNDQSRFNVKNTVSKTSLMGSKPVGRTPSRGQLQQIYNQYKGSQSYTQQNIRSPGQGTFSEGKINVALANVNQQRHVPVERVGGDTLANSQMVNQVPVKGQPMGHSGDVPADNKPHGDIMPTPEVPMKKCRNGLQDMVYTSYPSSAAWSFHGNHDRSINAPGHRLRGR